MSFQEAVIFLAAVIAIVAAGGALGAVLRGRSVRKDGDRWQLQERKANLYADLIGMLDTVADSSDMQKQRFIYKYYELLVYAPDQVVRAINDYLDAVIAIGAELAADEIMELRGRAIKIMRRDIRGRDSRSNLNTQELYRIEIQRDDSTEVKPGTNQESNSGPQATKPKSDKAADKSKAAA